MPSSRNRPHIIVPDGPIIENYSPYGRKIQAKKVPAPESRPLHGANLTRSLQSAVEQSIERRKTANNAGITIHGATSGIYIQFESQPGVLLNLNCLQSAISGIELVAVSERKTSEQEPKIIQMATVFVPDGKVKFFINRFQKYSKETPKEQRERRHESMIDPVANLRLATLRGLWTDGVEVYPAENETIWWEVWLRRHDGRELERLMEFASIQDINVSNRRLQFTDRIVVLVKATQSQLSASVDVLNDIAELQRAKETAAFFIDMSPKEQSEWVGELLDRITAPGGDAPAACILDTGVNRAHPLLAVATAAEDCTSIDPTWGPEDNGGGPHQMGHGTQMAGLALYGDLTSILESSFPIKLEHRIESVKILPPRGENRPELYGAITAEAAARVEVQAPWRRRCFSMAVTAEDERDQGQPTSWSAAIDALASGRTFDPASQGLIYLDEGDSGVKNRLFVLSAGNIDRSKLQVQHLDISDNESVHDPAQAWNALTVGAFTERCSITDQEWNNWEPVAALGDLSPWSTTSVPFKKQWPIKPDVVFEGGNLACDANNQIDFPCPDLSLLSTYYKPSEKSFVLSYATSAATAQVAQMAAIIKATYPSLWPESVRGLIVHSAEWTRRMHAHLRGASGKREREKLIRRYGFGVPNLNRALKSANNSLTLIAQGSIRPFMPNINNPNTRRMGEIQFFDLPWPKDVLQGLGEQPVRLRITLSYFVEPNPGRRGWTNRYRYSSHGLRFDMKGPTESLDEFRKRLNRQALDEEEEKPKLDNSDNWYLGEQARNRGSIHSDILYGFAADVAERGVIGVYPVSGWWKDQPKHDRSHKGARYALIVSIETDVADVDIWTPVALQVGLPIEV